MTRVAGIDGCPGGWFVVVVDFDDAIRQEIHGLYPTFKTVLEIKPTLEVTAIDIPIGLLDKPESGGRACDRLARRLLGPPRGSSVFPAPIRPVLGAKDYNEACQISSMSIQAFSLAPKIKEVDDLMSAELQNRVFEVHPEVSFRALAGRQMEHGKKRSIGHEERLKALRLTDFKKIDTALNAFPRKQVGRDDVLDAYIAAWTALRICGNDSVRGKAERFPENPPTDSRGLRMEIWY